MKIIISNKVLFPTDTMLRLGVVSPKKKLKSFKDYQNIIYTKLFALVKDGMTKTEYLLDDLLGKLGGEFYGDKNSSDDLTEFLMESDQMIYFLSDICKNWENLSKAEIQQLNTVVDQKSTMEGNSGDQTSKAKEYLKEIDIFNFLELLSMYLDT